ncbi:hypothetical protein SAMN05661010_03021 [Modicisalibacter muralis]|uniref:Uncharacterized protein n=1 Tax=Modicisalibacter muralis TaxID=119000 RepID=A0A1G9PDK2_9GAMM|nr:hypothetical protein [Halomonas muralis]SDL96942.1 hypothetical protein SAMN05661010_03021 [Halomonas muralis]
MSRRTMIIVALLAIALLSWLNFPQALARATIDDALGSAFSAFAIAKGLNATISVLQSSTVDFQVFQLSVGEALDPANDMIERFSWVMFAASGSLALQKLLLGMSSSAIIKGLFTLSCLISAALLALGEKRWRRVALNTTLVLAFLRFAVIVVALASGLAEKAFLEESRNTTMAQLQSSQRQLKALAESQIASRDGSDEEQQGWWDGLTDSVSDLVSNPVEGMTERFDAITDRVIDLTMIFIIQTMLFPLAFLYLLYRLTGNLLGRPTKRLALHR